MDSGSNGVKAGDLSGKTCIVTGSTSGIGLETTIGLAKLHGDIVMVGRSKEKCETVKNEINVMTGNENISYEVADLSSMESVRNLAEKILSTRSHIDILINNAGGFFSRYNLTKDGFEKTIALDYLSPVLLTRLLFPKLQSSGPARIINMGSSLHKSGKLDFDFKFPGPYRSMKAYSTSKLMITMFTYALARRVKETSISATLVEPGFVATNLGKNSGSRILSTSFGIMKPFQISAHEAAKTPIYLATYATNKEVNGKCYSRLKEIQTSKISYDEKVQEELWKTTSNALGLPSDGIRSL